MSERTEPEVPLSLIEDKRSQLEKLAESELPVSVDARQLLELAEEEVGQP